MNLFDKICACLAIPMGAAFMLLGAFGLMFGSNAHFTLPPISAACRSSSAGRCA